MLLKCQFPMIQSLRSAVNVIAREDIKHKANSPPYCQLNLKHSIVLDSENVIFSLATSVAKVLSRGKFESVLLADLQHLVWCRMLSSSFFVKMNKPAVEIDEII